MVNSGYNDFFSSSKLEHLSKVPFDHSPHLSTFFTESSCSYVGFRFQNM